MNRNGDFEKRILFTLLALLAQLPAFAGAPGLRNKTGTVWHLAPSRRYTASRESLFRMTIMTMAQETALEREVEMFGQEPCQIDIPPGGEFSFPAKGLTALRKSYGNWCLWTEREIPPGGLVEHVSDRIIMVNIRIQVDPRETEPFRDGRLSVGSQDSTMGEPLLDAEDMPPCKMTLEASFDPANLSNQYRLAQGDDPGFWSLESGPSCCVIL